DIPSLPTVTEQCEMDLTVPTATDNCDGTVTATTDASFPITESTMITWTYEDAEGNTSTQTQQVTINDTTAPEPDADNLSALTSAGSLARADVTAPTATDNCDGQITATTDAVFPVTASATITWTYEDEAGNMSTQTQQVTITEAPLGAAGDAAEAVIFPNPSGHYLEVRSPVGGVFKIVSLSGKLLLEGTTNTRVDILSLKSGLYLVQLPDGRLLKFVRE
ncbi:MAG: T9SS type A sorting domain-containing protein, partial [Ekhidna sp.]|nr:T9SS type A sorting domain-containing protein [Ekhidna sp.]